MLLAILVVGCAEGDVSSVDESKTTSGESVKEIETTSKTALEQEAGQLELIEWDIEKGEYGDMNVVGVVENNTSEDLAFVTISFAVYDADGFKLGTTEDIIESLGAGEKWKFNAMIFEENAVEVKVISLDAF
jgi:hypothetical protein